MFPAFFKLSQVVSSCLWAVPWHSAVWGSWAHPRPGTSSTDRCQPRAATATAICWRKSHVCRVVSSIEWLFSMFRLFHLCDSLINFIQFHHPLWIWNSNFSTRHRRFSGSLARWLVGASLLVSHAIGGYWPKVSSWPRLWCLNVIHLIWFILIQWICSSIFLHVVPCFLRCFGSCFHMLSNLTTRDSVARADVTGRFSQLFGSACHGQNFKLLDPCFHRSNAKNISTRQAFCLHPWIWSTV